MKSFFRFAILALTLVVVALVSALTAMRFAIHGQEVEVPAIVGLTPADAGRSVAGLGFQMLQTRVSALRNGISGAADWIWLRRRRCSCRERPPTKCWRRVRRRTRIRWQRRKPACW